MRFLTSDAKKPFTYPAGVAQKGEKKARQFPNGFEAKIYCYRCMAIFDSPDKRSVKHCDRCRIVLALLANELGVEAEET